MDPNLKELSPLTNSKTENIFIACIPRFCKLLNYEKWRGQMQQNFGV
jgi:hypothetical protein